MHRVACHECDLVQNIGPMPAKGKALCPRCGAVVAQTRPDSVNATLAWTFAAMVLYSVAVTFPFLAMRSGSIVRETALVSGIQQLFLQGKVGLATLVLLTCLVVPVVQMMALIIVFIPIKFKLRFGLAVPVFRLLRHCQPWSMMEIYMLGILVAMVKLAKMATIVPGIAVGAFGCLVVVLTIALSSVDEHLVWDYLEGRS